MHLAIIKSFMFKYNFSNAAIYDTLIQGESWVMWVIYNWEAIFKLYLVFMYNFLFWNVRIFPKYILLTRRINNFWDQVFIVPKMFRYPQIIYYPCTLKAFLPFPLIFNTFQFCQWKLFLVLFFFIFWHASIPAYCWKPCYRH